METAAVDVLNRSQAGAYWKKCYGWKQAPGGVGGICRASFRFLVTAESVRSVHLHCRCTTVFSRSRCLAAVDSHEHVSKGPFSPSFLTFFKRKRCIKSQDEGNRFRMEKVEQWWCNRKQNLAHISFLQQACFSH